MIRPRQASNVGRVEKDRERLQKLYQEGYDDAAGCFQELMEFLKDA